jgi:hypothetical protein
VSNCCSTLPQNTRLMFLWTCLGYGISTNRLARAAGDPIRGTTSYGIGHALGKPAAAGRGWRRRPQPGFIIVPCHRVVGSNGALTMWAAWTANRSATRKRTVNATTNTASDPAPQTLKLDFVLLAPYGARPLCSCVWPWSSALLPLLATGRHCSGVPMLPAVGARTLACCSPIELAWWWAF